MFPTVEYLEDVLRRHDAERAAKEACRDPVTGQYTKGAPGRPKGATDLRPRMPKGWKQFMADVYAGRVAWDFERRHLILVNPETYEPVVDKQTGKVINPPYFEAAAKRLMSGLIHVDYGNRHLMELARLVREMAADRGGRGLGIIIFTGRAT